jgi:hypothetical protein
MSSSLDRGKDELVNRTQTPPDENAVQVEINDSPSLEFTRFPKLPIELRRLVWNHATAALPEDRIIEIFVGTLEHITLEGPVLHNDAWPMQERYSWHAFHPDVAPTIFFVCKEANAEVQRSLEPLRGTDAFPIIWYNPRCDIIALRYEESFLDPWTRNLTVREQLFKRLTRSGKINKLLVMHSEMLCVATIPQVETFMYPWNCLDGLYPMHHAIVRLDEVGTDHDAHIQSDRIKQSFRQEWLEKGIKESQLPKVVWWRPYQTRV